MLIRKAEAADMQAIAAIILPTIREGTTYSLDPKMSEADALAYYWLRVLVGVGSDLSKVRQTTRERGVVERR